MGSCASTKSAAIQKIPGQPPFHHVLEPEAHNSKINGTSSTTYDGGTVGPSQMQAKSSDPIAEKSEIVAQQVKRRLERIQSVDRTRSPPHLEQGNDSNEEERKRQVENHQQLARETDETVIKNQTLKEEVVEKVEKEVVKDEILKEVIKEEIKKEVDVIGNPPITPEDCKNENVEQAVVEEVMVSSTLDEDKNVEKEDKTIVDKTLKNVEPVDDEAFRNEVKKIDEALKDKNEHKDNLDKAKGKEDDHDNKGDKTLKTVKDVDKKLDQILVKEELHHVVNKKVENEIKREDVNKTIDIVISEEKVNKNHTDIKVEPGNIENSDQPPLNESKTPSSIYTTLINDNAELALESSSASKLQCTEDIELYTKYPELEQVLNDCYIANKAMKTKKDPEYFEEIYNLLHDNVLKPFSNATVRDHRRLISYHMVKIGFAKVLTAYYKYLLEYSGITFYTGGDDSMCDKVICLLRELAWRLSMYSVKLAYKFGLSGYLELITDDLTALKHSVDDEKSRYAVQSSLGVLLNCAKSDSNRQYYRELHVAQLLMHFIHSKISEIKVIATIILASIVDEKHSLVIVKDGTVFTLIVKMIMQSVAMATFRVDGISAATWLRALIGIASIDRCKYKFVETGALDALCSVLKTGGNKEKRLATVALWCLALEDKCLDSIKNHEDLLNSLMQLDNTDSTQAALAVSGISWIKDYKKDTKLERKSAPGRQVYLSHSLTDSKLVTKIKAHLESRDIAVWMDDGGVSSIDCLHSALEGSTAVLACITDHYRDSPQNRAEIIYSNLVNIPIVPILLQRGFTPDGWLKSVVSEKIAYDFSAQFSFEENMDGIVKDLTALMDKSPAADDDVKAVSGKDIVVEISSPSKTSPQSSHEKDNTLHEPPSDPYQVNKELQNIGPVHDSKDHLKVPATKEEHVMEKTGVAYVPPETSLNKPLEGPVPAPRRRKKPIKQKPLESDGNIKAKDSKKEKALSEWTDKEVMVWLQANKLDKAKKLYFLSGDQLSFLCNLYKTAPEFFYTYVQNNLGVHDLDLLMNFSNALGKQKT